MTPQKKAPAVKPALKLVEMFPLTSFPNPSSCCKGLNARPNACAHNRSSRYPKPQRDHIYHWYLPMPIASISRFTRTHFLSYSDSPSTSGSASTPAGEWDHRACWVLDRLSDVGVTTGDFTSKLSRSLTWLWLAMFRRGMEASSALLEGESTFAVCERGRQEGNYVQRKKTYRYIQENDWRRTKVACISTPTGGCLPVCGDEEKEEYRRPGLPRETTCRSGMGSRGCFRTA